jgi:hypothetical protein
MESDYNELQNFVIASEEIQKLPVTSGLKISSEEKGKNRLIESISEGGDDVSEDFVVLRHIETQTESATNEMDSLNPEIRQGRDRSLSGSTAYSLNNESEISSKLIGSTRGEQLHIKMLNNRLSYATLIAEAQAETIEEMERIIHQSDDELNSVKSTVARLELEARQNNPNNEGITDINTKNQSSNGRMSVANSVGLPSSPISLSDSIKALVTCLPDSASVNPAGPINPSTPSPISKFTKLQTGGIPKRSSTLIPPSPLSGGVTNSSFSSRVNNPHHPNIQRILTPSDALGTTLTSPISVRSKSFSFLGGDVLSPSVTHGFAPFPPNPPPNRPLPPPPSSTEPSKSSTGVTTAPARIHSKLY